MTTVDLTEYASWALGTLLLIAGMGVCVRGQLLIVTVGKLPHDADPKDPRNYYLRRGPRLFRLGLVLIVLGGIVFYIPSLLSMTGLI